MIQVIAIVFAFALMHLLISSVGRGKERVRVAFAGSPELRPSVVEIPRPRHEPKYTLNGVEIEKRDLEPILITGHSLEKWGINDGDVVYVNRISKEEISKYDFLNNKFVIFKIDNDRTKAEKGYVEIVVKEGLKARKFITAIAHSVPDEEREAYFTQVLANDKDFQCLNEEEKKLFRETLTKKYLFARQYYSNDTELLFSETYRHNGSVKGYSFHSPKYLYGYVKFKVAR